MLGILGGLPAISLFAEDKTAAEPPLVVEPILDSEPPIQRVDQATEETPIGDEDREHWAFTALHRPALADVENAAWCRTGVDRFVLAKLEENELHPTPHADRIALVRRLSFDLAGLPPSPDEVAAFVADRSPDAYERLVDRLLASPAHGERMAQHWLDLARFAETDGYEHDLVRKNAWRYRDWVIDALNADMPYDRFVAMQLAGDELAPGDEQAAIATGFCVAGPDMPDINSQQERRHNVLNDVASTVGSVFLALQVGCAQCHDHKYDPISQRDFYRLRACFESAVKFEKNKPNDMMRAQEKPMMTHVAVRGDYRRQGAIAPPAVPRIADLWQTSLPAPGANSGKNPRVAFAEWLARSDHPLTWRVVANRLWQQHFGVGLSQSPSDFGIMGDEPEHLELLDWLASELPSRGGSMKSLRRLLVTSATYRQASRLSTPGWTDAERMAASTAWTKAAEADAANRLWWKYPRRRLDGESLRDAMLSVAGVLSTRRGGPGIMQPLPEEVTRSLLANQWKVDRDEENHYRRSIYLFARRNLRDPLFEVFDRPDGNASCPVRNRSTTAPQALELFNSKFALEAARRMAGRVLTAAASGQIVGAASDEAAWASKDYASRAIRLAFAAALSRSPTAHEIASSVEFLAVQAKAPGDEKPPPSHAAPIPLPVGASRQEEDAAFVDFCLVLINGSEFLYRD
ncbi:MAG: DUF1549 and DUF1553 domain-containing protein [Pirellulales bacterium]